jgi:hypothetical protein
MNNPFVSDLFKFACRFFIAQVIFIFDPHSLLWAWGWWPLMW